MKKSEPSIWSCLSLKNLSISKVLKWKMRNENWNPGLLTSVGLTVFLQVSKCCGWHIKINNNQAQEENRHHKPTKQQKNRQYK